jgi:hypothetical protein
LLSKNCACVAHPATARVAVSAKSMHSFNIGDFLLQRANAKSLNLALVPGRERVYGPGLAMQSPAARALSRAKLGKGRAPPRWSPCFLIGRVLQVPVVVGSLETSPGRTQTTLPAAHLTSPLLGRHRTRRSHFGHYRSTATLTQVIRAHRHRGSSISTHTTLPAAYFTPARGGSRRTGTVLPGHLAERTTITRGMSAHRYRIQLRQEHRSLGLSLSPPTRWHVLCPPGPYADQEEERPGIVWLSPAHCQLLLRVEC